MSLPRMPVHGLLVARGVVIWGSVRGRSPLKFPGDFGGNRPSLKKEYLKAWAIILIDSVDNARYPYFEFTPAAPSISLHLQGDLHPTVLLLPASMPPISACYGLQKCDADKWDLGPSISKHTVEMGQNDILGLDEQGSLQVFYPPRRDRFPAIQCKFNHDEPMVVYEGNRT
ncbi:hypothetical protein BD779DRAFT_315421 [Infundibulicybe gibba]|nr:hypothetical protein BD779DRAFT_315421 [Infundibulicybe gibba]